MQPSAEMVAAKMDMWVKEKRMCKYTIKSHSTPRFRCIPRVEKVGYCTLEERRMVRRPSFC